MKKQIYRPPNEKKTENNKSPRKVLLFLSALLVLGLLVALGVYLGRDETPLIAAGSSSDVAALSQAEPPHSSTSMAVSQLAEEPKTLSLTFSAVGDNLIHDGIYLQAQRRAGGTGYDFSYVYENLKYFFEPFDVNWINQETLVNTQLPPATYPCFSTPGELGQAAYDAGWRVFSLSNNHTYDMGAKGITATREFWANMPSDVVVPGLYTTDDVEDSEILLHEVNGITLAYLSYTEATNGIPTPTNSEAHIIYTSQTDLIQKQVQRAAQLADAVVVSVHWGVEGSHEVSTAQRELANNLASWGATVILGTHPHVIQPIEWISSEDRRQVLVAYSLGNFLSAQSAANNMVGLCLTYQLTQQIESDGTRGVVEVEDVKAYPTVTHYDTNYANIRDYMYRDYTAELAAKHGVRARNSSFSLEYIEELTQQYISPEFLVLG